MLPALWPGVIESYDASTKTARVAIPGLTDGADEKPVAQFVFPVGDKSEHTDIRVLAGDRVWLAFLAGDAAHPIVVGYRPKEAAAVVDVRRMHHKVMEFRADTDLTAQADSGTVTIKAGTLIRLQAPGIRLEAPTTVTGLLTYEAGITGSGIMVNNSKNVGSSHGHTGVKSGPNISGAPV
jgi:Type VI secretion system/phage-baseplate injector OB domain